MSSVLINPYTVSAAGGPGTWLPDDEAALAGWFDAADAGTITESGGLVSAWADKSATGMSLTQGTDANKPTTGATTLNALNVLTFDGGDRLFDTTATLPDNNPGVTALVVSAWDHAANAGMVLWATNAGASAFSWTLGRTTANNLAFRGDHGVAAAQAAFNDNTTAWQVLAGTGTLSLREIYQNGTLKDDDADTDVEKVAGRLYVGGTNDGIILLTGKVAEIVIFSGTDTTIRQKGEGYLAWKWGLQGNLDAGHPYKNSGPN